MKEIEWIKEGESVLAVVIRRSFAPDKTQFITPLDYMQQIGFIVHDKDEKIPPHVHVPQKRNLTGTSEVLWVRSGRVEVTFYSNARKEVARRVLESGDVVLLVGGGHGFRMLEETVMLELKQGPYIGLEEKERFEP